MEATAMPEREGAEWSAAVFGRNEAAHIAGCLDALAVAATGRDLHVTVLLNGTTDASPGLAAGALRRAGLRGRVVLIDGADKANAINHFIHRLRPRSDLAFFVDGYAAVEPEAPRRMAEALRAHPAAQAVAAVPSTGRSAAALREEMRREPGLHGSLFALRGAFLDRVAAAGLRLPLGLYRGDGLIGTMVLHDLDAAQPWRPERLVVEEGATWRAPQLSPFRWRDLRRHGYRLVQQARGRLQWHALKEALYAPGGGFAAMPADADAHAVAWVLRDRGAREPDPWRDPFAALALHRMRRAAPRGDLTPCLPDGTPA